MSCTVTAVDKFLETETDIKALVERIALGPQEAVINKINALNSNFSTDFKSTAKFRWQPGFYKKLNEHAIRMSGYGAKKRKISTYHNGVRAAEWHIGRFFKQIQEIDTDLWRLRTSDMTFQDNTEAVELAIQSYKEDIINSIEMAHQMNPSISITPYLGLHSDSRNDRRYSTGNRTTINFHVKISNITMKVVCGEEHAYTDAGDVDLIYTVDLIKNVMQRIRRSTSNDQETFSLIHNMNLHMGHTGELQGGLYSPNIRDTRFPYISGNETWSASMRVDSVDDNGSRIPYKYSNVCFGSYAHDIAEAFWQGDMMAVSINLKGWSSLFKIGSTNPLNGYQRLFHGLPEVFNQPHFINAGRLPHKDGTGCHISRSDASSAPSEVEDSGCYTSNCSLMDTCNWHNDIYRPAAVPNPIEELEVLINNLRTEATIEVVDDTVTHEEARLIQMYSGRSVI